MGEAWTATLEAGIASKQTSQLDIALSSVEKH